MTEPYLLVTADRAGTRISGTPNIRLGEQLPRPEGRADGVYGGWSWDGRTVRADNDRYGMYPLYYFSTAERFAISPSVPALLSIGAPTELDEAALAVFLRLGFFLGEDTAFRAIRALPPDATVEWCEGRLGLSGGFPAWLAQPLGRDPAIEGYIELFRIAMGRRVRPDEEVGVPLSGGRDSRHILLELCRAGRRPKLCITLQPYPPHPNEDAVAAQVAGSVDLPHVVVSQGGSRIHAELQKNRLTNFCADEHAWYLALGEYLRGRVRHIYDGIGGDVLSAGLFLTVERLAWFDAGRFEELAVSLLGPSESRLRLVATGWTARLGRDPAVARLAYELTRHAGAPNPVGAFYFWNRTRREIALAPYRILNRSAEVLSPYLDHDLYDFLASLPASLFLDHDFHSETIRRAYPKYRDIRFEEKEVNPDLGAGSFRRFARETTGYFLRTALTPSAIRLASSRFVLPWSLLGAMVGRSSRFGWELAVFAVYLQQLSHEMERPRIELLEGDR